MQVPIVIYDADMTRQEIGHIDVFNHNFDIFPVDLQSSMDQALLSGDVEFVFNRIPLKGVSDGKTPQAP